MRLNKSLLSPFLFMFSLASFASNYEFAAPIVPLYYYSNKGCEQIPIVDGGDGSYYSIAPPFFSDANHEVNNGNILALLAVIWNKSYSVEGIIGQLGSTLSLKDAKIVFHFKTIDINSPAGVKMGFWIQSFDPERYRSNKPSFSNYIIADELYPLDELLNKQDFVLTFHVAADRLSCLGSSSARASRYFCFDDPSIAVERWNVDMGLVLLSNTIDGIENITTGSILLKKVEVVVPNPIIHYQPFLFVQKVPQCKTN